MPKLAKAPIRRSRNAERVCVEPICVAPRRHSEGAQSRPRKHTGYGGGWARDIKQSASASVGPAQRD